MGYIGDTGVDLTSSEVEMITNLTSLATSTSTQAIQKISETEFANVELNVSGAIWGQLTGTLSNQTDLQDALDTKADILAGTINEIAYFNTVSNVTSLSVSTYPSLAELSYVKGVTSAIQTQLNGKEPSITSSTANTVWHGNKTFSAVVEADISLSDNATNDVSTVKHGFMSKLPGGTTIFYRGDGTFAAPANVTVPNAYVIQAFSNTTYNLVHNLGSYPVVQVLDSTGAVVIPLSIVNNTVNDLTVTFTTTGTYTIIATLGSPQLQSYTSTAVNYSALVTDRIIEVTALGKTITLPTANVTNTGYEYKIDNSSAGDIYVVSQGGETIQGEVSQTVPPDSCLSIYANGTKWRID